MDLQNKTSDFDLASMLQKGISLGSDKENSDIIIQAIKDIENRSRRKFEVFSEKMKDFESCIFKIKQENLQVKQSLEIANKFTIDSKKDILEELKEEFEKLAKEIRLLAEKNRKKLTVDYTESLKTYKTLSENTDRIIDTPNRKTIEQKRESYLPSSLNEEDLNKIKEAVESRMKEVERKIEIMAKFSFKETTRIC